MQTYILDLRDQTTENIFPRLFKNIDYYFYNYNINKEDGVLTISLFENDIHCVAMKFLYTESQIINNINIQGYSLTVLLDYNASYYNRAEILQLIYSLFNSIRIYGIMEG